MKKIILLFALISSLAVAQQIQPTLVHPSKETATGNINQSSAPIYFKDGNGSVANEFEIVVSGSPSALAVNVYGCSPSNTCTATALATSSGTGSQNLLACGPYDNYEVLATFSGGTSPSIIVNRVAVTGTNCSSGGVGTTVSVSNFPTSQNVVCTSGCGGNPNGQATMANSAPVAIASNQSAIPVTQSGTWTVQPGNTPNTSPWLTTDSADGTSGSAVPLKIAYAGGNNGGNLIGFKADTLGDLDVNVENTPSVNLTQFGGSNVATGTGASGAGVPRVTVSNDSSLAANQSVNINQVAGVTPVNDPCQFNARSLVKINTTSSVQLITGTSGKQTYVCWIQFGIDATGSDNVALVEGTGTLCATSIAGMAGGTTAATGWNLLANGSVTGGAITSWGYKTATTADNVCLIVSAANQISGVVQYVQQ